MVPNKIVVAFIIWLIGFVVGWVFMYRFKKASSESESRINLAIALMLFAVAILSMAYMTVYKLMYLS